MNLPKTIRVAAFDVDVIEWGIKESATNDAFGEFSAAENQIRVCTDLAPIKALDTLIHEINHAIYWAYRLHDDDNEEQTVSVMATAWVQIYRDNPLLLDLITQTLPQP